MPPAAPVSIRRRRPVLLLGLGLVAMLALSGCGRPTDPTSYTAGVKKNFVKGCAAGFTGKPSATQAKDNRAICECVIQKITRPPASGGIKFADFAAATSKLRGDPQKYSIDKVLPQAVTFLTDCTNQVTPTTVAGPVATTN